MTGYQTARQRKKMSGLVKFVCPTVVTLFPVAGMFWASAVLNGGSVACFSLMAALFYYAAKAGSKPRPPDPDILKVAMQPHLRLIRNSVGDGPRVYLYGVPSASVWTRETPLTVLFSYPPDDPEENIPYFRGKGLPGACVARKSILVQDVPSINESWRVMLQLSRAELVLIQQRTAAMMCVPIYCYEDEFQDEVAGVLSIESPSITDLLVFNTREFQELLREISAVLSLLL